MLKPSSGCNGGVDVCIISAKSINELTMNAKNLILTLSVAAAMVACKKPPVDKPVDGSLKCTEEVVYQYPHMCSGYILQRKDGSLLRATEYTQGGQALYKLFDGRKQGDKLTIGYTRPESNIDCTVIDTIPSTRVKLGCIEWVTGGNPKR
jgi:hypothetical protein